MNNGGIVYVNDKGEKYHYSYAGENAIATTLFDAEAYEYEPVASVPNNKQNGDIVAILFVMI